MRTFFRWLLGKPATTGDPLAQALERFADPDADTLELIRRLVAELRPRGRRDEAVAERYRAMLDRLVADPALRTAFCGHVVHFIATRRLVTFFTDSGILPGTGFFSEWGRILGNRLLPDGRRGVFHPDRLSFGQTLYLSPLQAAALGVALARPDMVAVYPITPQTSLVEKLAKLIADGHVDKAAAVMADIRRTEREMATAQND